jgi:anti-anti-sigma factor
MKTALNNQAVVTVSARPGAAVACVRIVGEVDLAAESALADAANQLSVAAPRVVFIDLAAVTFGGSTLVTFLVRVLNAVPNGLSLVLCRPTPMVHRVISLTSLHLLAVVCDDPPPRWAATGDRAAVDVCW